MTTPKTSGNEGQHSGGGFTARQHEMLLASDPDDVTGEEGVGVELLNGADYAVARSLERRGLGYVTGPGSYSGMYWNTAEGLTARALALGTAPGSVGGGSCTDDTVSQSQPLADAGPCPRSHDNHSFDGKEGA